MKIKDNKAGTMHRMLVNELEGIYGKREASTITSLLFEGYLGWQQKELLLNKEHTLTESEILKFLFALKRLKKHEPVQYILGYTWFDGLKLEIKSGALIPRQETEELVQLVSNVCEGSESILDIGTGSGCIALALKKRFPAAQIVALERSEIAISQAKENATRLQLYVEFIQTDILEEDVWVDLPNFDIIVSNPPYVTEIEKADMQPNVLKYEPHDAIFAPANDPLIFYRAIGKFASQHLNPNGHLFMEINETLGIEVKDCLKQIGFRKTDLQVDINDKQRMVHAKLE